MFPTAKRYCNAYGIPMQLQRNANASSTNTNATLRLKQKTLYTISYGIAMGAEHQPNGTVESKNIPYHFHYSNE